MLKFRFLSLSMLFMCRNGILFLVLLIVFLFSFGQKSDVKPATTKSQYIMHVVKFGETLTKISQKYGVTKTEILKANPSMTADNLHPEDIIRIPKNVNSKDLTSSQTKGNTTSSKVKVNEGSSKISANFHIVEKGQTLYIISKMYGVKVEDLQKWNQLKDTGLKIGMKLAVSDPSAKKNTTLSADKLPQESTEPMKKETVNPNSETLEVKDEPVTPDMVKEDEENTEPEKPETQAVENESQKELSTLYKSKLAGGKVVNNKGTGAPMTTTLGAMESVYFAMHKTLAIGTIIKIKNLVNNKVIYAKVIGKLPDNDENKHVIVRYSLGVKKDLQLQNGKCYVQIEYIN